MNLGLAAIGGKDSMSGTYQDINVPPTLISFACADGKKLNTISPEFKKLEISLSFPSSKLKENGLPNYENLIEVFDYIHQGIQDTKKIVSVKTIKDGGVAVAVAKMSLEIFSVQKFLSMKILTRKNIGGLVIESTEKLDSNFSINR